MINSKLIWNNGLLLWLIDHFSEIKNYLMINWVF